MERKRPVLRAIKTALSVAMACSLSAGTVQAATISDLKMSGWDELSQEKQEYFMEGIKDIPKEVARLYRRKGGRIYFVDGLLSPSGQDVDPSVMGLYWYGTHKIELSIDSRWAAACIQMNVAHELGHYLYDETYNLWAEETINQLSAEYSYWSQYAPECTDEVEAFAYLYSLYRGTRSNYISQRCKDMFEEAEAQCAYIYDRSSRGARQEIGPGFALPDEKETAEDDADMEAVGREVPEENDTVEAADQGEPETSAAFDNKVDWKG